MSDKQEIARDASDSCWLPTMQATMEQMQANCWRMNMKLCAQ
jgi:hypothetical protein